MCVLCLLKAASSRKEDEETKKEVEMALLALSCDSINRLNLEQYLNETKEIILYHQEHHNLSRLAYHLEEVIVNELHFTREAIKELEDRMKCVDWRRKEGEKGGIERKEELILLRWVQTLTIFFANCHLWNEEYAELFSSIVQVFRASRENYKGISDWSIYSLSNAAHNKVVKDEELNKSGAIDAVLEEIQRPTLNDKMTNEHMEFFVNASRKLKWKKKDGMDEAKRKELKRKMFEKLEEEGYEDIIVTRFEKKTMMKMKDETRFLEKDLEAMVMIALIKNSMISFVSTKDNNSKHG
ncbi:uncharacterized protein MONOS_17932 [Monocercomonoides exilis]|uniref:uncharacterized protein n=1 Tax=Monocercomonoides exilis TaxID=2049356 RepID=UPI003559D8F0|nr:hypothetical protein MONOS_17932 [Monocercomonoides exilis]